MDAFDRLYDVVARLRGDGGCPWDRAQTPESLAPFVLEEAAEVVDAIERGDARELRGELGDLSFLVLLLARIHEERGTFGAHDALTSAADKMVRRHPHVFGGDGTASDWEAIKASEHAADGTTRESLLDAVPRSLPALQRAQELGRRAGEAGFDWPDAEGPRRKLDEELAELGAAVAEGGPAEVAEELGDVLFSVVNLARHLGVDAEAALRATNRKFASRFRDVERQCLDEGATVHTTDAETLEAHWTRAKHRERP